MKRMMGVLLLGFLLAGCGAGSVDPVSPPVEVVNLGEAVLPAESSEASTMSDLDELSGLPISNFFEEGFGLLLARDPEGLLELGLYDGPPILTDISAEALDEENQINRGLLEMLHGYDFDSLTDAEKISFLVFEYYLQREIQIYEDRNFVYLVNSMGVRSKPQLYIMFFTDSHPMVTAQDAEDYVARVQLLDEKIDQLIERIEAQAAEGIIPPRVVLEYGRSDLRNYTGRSALTSPLLSAFREKAAIMSSLDPKRGAELDEELQRILKEEVFPAFDRLDDLLADLQNKAPGAVGLYAYPGGDEVYQHMLERFTTTGLTADEIHNRGLAEVDRIQTEMRSQFADLGYPEDESIPQLYQRLATDSGFLMGDDITAEYENILREAEANLGEHFDQALAGQLEVVGGTVGAFYSPGSMDGSRPGRFYARITNPEPVYMMKSLAYHEGIPGHHYQISTAARADVPFFRNLVSFTGYVEGWALYSEYLAAEMGWYEGDAYGDLGRLQYEMLRACRMVVDTGIHARGWSFEQAVDYMADNSAFSRGFVEYQILRYISYPAHSTAYLVGKIEIMRIREEAEAALGEDFDLREFHTLILSNGSMPLAVLERVVDEWVAGGG